MSFLTKLFIPSKYSTLKYICSSQIFRSNFLNNLFENKLRCFHTTFPKNDLMEFFDDKLHWGQRQVKVGRAWKKEELRIKSNSDLHKLWYVLLKEKNMLLTMEHESKEQFKLFPNPERIEKVELSMKNLEDVVRERNIAFHELETGQTGERPYKLTRNMFGLRCRYKMFEYTIPKYKNEKWFENFKFSTMIRSKETTEFLKKYREERYLTKRRARNRDIRHVAGLFKRFPNMDLEAVKEEYPDVDINKALKYKRSSGNHENNTA